MKNSNKFFRNDDCKYFPCHQGMDPDSFNCLFCYCPLYFLGPDCGGDFVYNEKGVKDCQECTKPHLPEYYNTINSKLKEAIKRGHQYPCG